mgnify:CR=1 FL=1
MAALSRRMPDACPSTVPASRVAAAVGCSSAAASGGGVSFAAAAAALLVSVPTTLFRCGPAEQEEQYRSFFLQLAVDVSEQVRGRRGQGGLGAGRGVGLRAGLGRAQGEAG